MHAIALPAGSPVFVDSVLPRTRTGDLLLVAAGTLLVAILAQVRIPLGFTPVPLTLQTLGVAFVGAGLGARRGAFALALYVLAGTLGLPFFAGGQGGTEHLLGPTGGYLVGFVAAAAAVGKLAEWRSDRRPLSAFLALQVGSLVLFTFGVAGLAIVEEISLGEAIRLGWLPFLPGDLLKTAVAAGVLPLAWRFVR